MTDEQLRVRMINKRIITVALLLFVISAALVYYWIYTQSDVDTYRALKARESGLNTQIQSLESENAALRATIDQTGKELVSFSENKIKYINLASSLSQQCGVQINKLSVSDVWDEGQMSGMTTSIEVEGTIENIKDFISSYCGTNYTNRINVVSCRPAGRYPWLKRTIDGDKVLTWFDLGDEQSLYDDYVRQERQQISQAMQEAGIGVGAVDSEGNPIDVGELLGQILPSEGEEDTAPITLASMFAPKVYRVYLEIDFLGRQ